jgi:hypothetical protein
MGHRSVSILLALAALAPSTLAARDGDVHESRAQRFLERHGAVSAPTDVEALLAGFAHVRIGHYQVLIPPHVLRDDTWLPSIQGALQRLLDSLLLWIEWLPDPPTDRRPPSSLASDAKTLGTWIKGLKVRSFKNVGPDRLELLEATGAKEKVVAAAAGLSGYFAGGGPLVARESELAPSRVVFTPSREDFVEFLCLVGMIDQRHRSSFWSGGPEIWTTCEFDGLRVLAFEYATPDAARDYTWSISMTGKNPRALNEHVVQVATRSLLDASFDGRMDPMLAAGLANDLVIELCGEVDTRSDGDSRATVIGETSTFVAGGNPTGGTLPPADASSRWREKKGEDYFVGVLRKAQKAGARSADEPWQKRASFPLLDDDQARTYVLHAPVLGLGATDSPPEAFLGDYAEFLRAYRAAFLHWLMQRGGGSTNGSRAKFAQVLRGIARGELPLPAVFDEVYGAPLSSLSGEELFDEPVSLEGRFLAWLAKQ